MNRRRFLAAGAGLPLLTPATTEAAQALGPSSGLINATDFGAHGDGRQDNSAALQAGLDAALNGEAPSFLMIPAGNYRVTRPLRVDLARNVARPFGISARGAVIESAVDGGPVLEITSRATVRYALIDGLHINGGGRDGHGLSIRCEEPDRYFYDFCLRDLVIERCGGDGARLIGNVFEGQIFNSYFRDNGGNGLTLGHGKTDGILSAIHVFGSVFGGNGSNGSGLINNCYDVAFHGCYFLENAKYGLSAGNGCTLIANCGFENNHDDAGFGDPGGAGIRLLNFGTLIACTGYSRRRQTHLLRAFVKGQLVMIACASSGHGPARGAKLAQLQGSDGVATLIGCSGGLDVGDGLRVNPVGEEHLAEVYGARWDSTGPLRLGDYRLWVDESGSLRIKAGAPNSDLDGEPVGARAGNRG